MYLSLSLYIYIYIYIYVPLRSSTPPMILLQSELEISRKNKDKVGTPRKNPTQRNDSYSVNSNNSYYINGNNSYSMNSNNSYHIT